jgi:hypothetical protein
VEVTASTLSHNQARGGDGALDVIVRYRQGKKRRTRAFSGLDGSPLPAA